ncbi:hypothetical protein MRX96_039347 [Rhipicephalus microplus]
MGSLDGYVAPLCALLQASSCLKRLHLWGKLANEQAVGTLMTMLLNKPTLEELNIGAFSLDSDVYLQCLREYISSTTALKNLSLTTRNRSLQMTVLEGVLKNRSIATLSLRMFEGTEESTALASRIIRENRVIRSLSIVSTYQKPRGLHSVYDCWVTPLIQNDVLEEVTLWSSILHPTKWFDYFRSLPMKQRLKMVRILPDSPHSHIQQLCAELKDNLKLPALRQLANCQHLESFCISIDSDHMRLSLALADYLRSTTTLRGLELDIRCNAQEETHGRKLWWNAILEAISQSKSVNRLDLTMSGLNIQDSQDLATSVKCSTYIRELAIVNTPKANNTAFFRCFSDNIQENYTLASVKLVGGIDAHAVSHWLTVKETTWRNLGFVARAARLIEASDSDRYVTSAVEHIARYPALMDEVAETAKLDLTELGDLPNKWRQEYYAVLQPRLDAVTVMPLPVSKSAVCVIRMKVCTTRVDAALAFPMTALFRFILLGLPSPFPFLGIADRQSVGRRPVLRRLQALVWSPSKRAPLAAFTSSSDTTNSKV